MEEGRGRKGKGGIGRQERGSEGSRRQWGMEGMRGKEIKMDFGRGVRKRTQSSVDE